MTDLVTAFIAELIRAANEIDRVTMHERSALLRRAASTIREYQVARPDGMRFNGPELLEMAATLPNAGTDEEAAVSLRLAAELIRGYRTAVHREAH